MTTTSKSFLKDRSICMNWGRELSSLKSLWRRLKRSRGRLRRRDSNKNLKKSIVRRYRRKLKKWFLVMRNLLRNHLKGHKKDRINRTPVLIALTLWSKKSRSLTYLHPRKRKYLKNPRNKSLPKWLITTRSF